PIAAIWASSPSDSMFDSRLPFMIFCLGTFPPHLLMAPSEHILWSQIPILCRMPLGSQVGMIHRQGVRCNNHEANATGTTTALGPVGDFRLPFMVTRLRTLPPDFRTAPRNHVMRRERSILGRVPLSG